MTPDTATVAATIEAALDADELPLPTLPEVALKVRDEAASPNATTASLAAVIKDDPGLAARILRVANSPLMRGAVEIVAIDNAVSRMGMGMAGNLAMGFAMENMFQATREVVDEVLRDLWQRSRDAAAIAGALARFYTRVPPDLAMLAGLTHGLGALPVLAWAEDHGGDDLDRATLEGLIIQLAPGIGTRILGHWELPAAIVPVPQLVVEFGRQHDGEPDIVDVVTVARLQALEGTPHPHADIDRSGVLAFQRLGLDHETDTSEAEEMVVELQEALS